MAEPVQLIPPDPAKRLMAVDALRGAAALMVVWYHFTSGADDVLPVWLKASGVEGRLGLFVFFVISGFIIPYAMGAAHFRLQDFGRFMLKRVMRLDPPYLVVVLLCLVLMQFSAIRHEFSWRQLFAHFGYANAFLGYPWYNRVFWTLAIEFQWYLLAALLFSLWRRACGITCWVWAAVLLLTALMVDVRTTVVSYLPLFLLGLAVFWQKTGRLRKDEMLVMLIGAAAFCEWRLEPGAGFAGFLTAVIIFYGRGGTNWLTALGTLSYSLYLVHLPIGQLVLKNLDPRFTTPMGMLLVRVLAVAASLVAAWLLWRLVEVPAMRWASKVQVSKKKPVIPPTAS